MNTKVQEFIDNSKKWQSEFEVLRRFALDCNLVEEFKWRNPCYTFQNSNVFLLGSFKDFCSLSFFKGVLLEDKKKVLVSPGENSNHVKYFKFTSVDEIIQNEALIKAYIFEAIELEKNGIKVQKSDKPKSEIPDELKTAFNNNENLKTAFEALTPGRQRGYLLFFNGAKQSKTVTARIDKHKERILKGKGIHDCICGLSKKMPNCDGSHKNIC